MTVSSNYAVDFSRDEIVRMAFQLCGVLEGGKEPESGDVAMASDFINFELKALQAEGVTLRHVERATLTLVSGTAAYTLPADTVDVEMGPNDEIGSILPSSGSETPVFSMTRAEYMALPDKTSTVTGRPTRAYVEKLSGVTVTLWPVPDSTSATMRYSRVRLIRDADDGAVTMDLVPKWLKYVAYVTAENLARAKSLPMETIKDLEGKAERQKAVCLADDGQKGKIRFHLAHSGVRW
jgi:hypothetical protein